MNLLLGSTNKFLWKVNFPKQNQISESGIVSHFSKSL